MVMMDVTVPKNLTPYQMDILRSSTCLLPNLSRGHFVLDELDIYSYFMDYLIYILVGWGITDILVNGSILQWN
jgi:hypothetical protein